MFCRKPEQKFLKSLYFGQKWKSCHSFIHSSIHPSLSTYECVYFQSFGLLICWFSNLSVIILRKRSFICCHHFFSFINTHGILMLRYNFDTRKRASVNCWKKADWRSLSKFFVLFNRFASTTKGLSIFFLWSLKFEVYITWDGTWFERSFFASMQSTRGNSLFIVWSLKFEVDFTWAGTWFDKRSWCPF